MNNKPKPWFWGAVAYEIYPRSFYDSDGDGIGDLRGIIEKLDYFNGSAESLAVDAIWLCPFYPSPMADFGYDISDYCAVDPVFGTLADFKELLAKAHERRIKVIIDLVVNHTSDEHPWFIESKKDTSNPKRDWYIWRDTPNGQLPNDWLSAFGGSAWQPDPSTGQSYLHSFSKKQPDLNWENPKVRQAVKDVMKFWLDLGVDGFRADAVYWLSKDHLFRDDTREHVYSRKGPYLFEYLDEMSAVLDEYENRIMVVEAVAEGGREPIEYLKFYQQPGQHNVVPFNFEGIYVDWKAAALKTFIDEFQAALKPEYLPVYTFGNHDRSRLASRIGSAQTRTAAMLLLTLPGMPFIYYGEEIGMENALLSPAKRLDPQATMGVDRDAFRTPLQWDSRKNAGFSTATPWVPVASNYADINIRKQLENDHSLLSLYRRLIRLRQASDSLKYGRYEPLQLGQGVLGFSRVGKDEKLSIVLSFLDSPLSLDDQSLKGEVLLSTKLDAAGKILAGRLELQPHEGIIIKHESQP